MEEVDERGAVRRRTTSAGNPQFLHEFRAANADLIELWGIQSSLQNEDQGNHAVPPSQMPDEEFKESIAAARKTRARHIEMKARMAELQNS